MVPAPVGDSLFGSVCAAEADLDAKVRAGLQLPAFITSMIAAGRFKEID